MVTKENYEEYILLHVDGELNTADTRALMSFLNKHPELKKELDAYTALKLAPDASLVFKGKEKLLKPVAGKAIALNKWWAYGAAAGMVFIILFFTLQKSNPQDQEQPFANNNTIAPSTQLKDTAEQKTENNLVTSQPQANKKKPVPVQLSEIKTPERREENLSRIQPVVSPVKNGIVQPEKMNQEQIEPIVIAPNTAEESENKPLAWMNVSDEKKEGFSHLKNDFQQKAERFKNIRNNIKQTDLVVKLGKKEIIVFNF